MWAAAGIPVVAYIVRAAERGWDFRPDMPLDALLGGLLLVLLGFAYWARSAPRSHGAGDELAPKVDAEHDDERDKR